MTEKEALEAFLARFDTEQKARHSPDLSGQLNDYAQKLTHGTLPVENAWCKLTDRQWSFLLVLPDCTWEQATKAQHIHKTLRRKHKHHFPAFELRMLDLDVEALKKEGFRPVSELID